MDSVCIQGGHPLNGTIAISGAKNAALPLMAASLLTEQTLTLHGVPHLADIATMGKLLSELGVAQETSAPRQGPYNGTSLSLTAHTLSTVTAPYDLVRRMRASILVLGPLLARCGTARVSLPGGCAIGSRPVNYHLNALEALGARIELDDGFIVAHAPGGLKGNSITFPQVSVGATENALMASVLASGDTTLNNAAREPEIADLARCLTRMGARIDGIGSDTLHIRGVPSLNGATHRVPPDRIEAGTYIMAVAVTGGDLTLTGIDADSLGEPIRILKCAGLDIAPGAQTIRVVHAGKRGEPAMSSLDVETAPYPGFPTDLQAQMMVVMAVSRGQAHITESIFENRFMHVSELRRMGADITLRGSVATVNGMSPLKGAEVMATDLRASVSLVLAGLAAHGTTIINRIYHLDRGYERLEEKLSACGAHIQRMKSKG